jgi:anti-anti-sigma factor
MALQLENPPRKDDSARGVTVVHFTGHKASLNEKAIDCIRDQLLALADEPGESELILDFGNVEYVSSKVLGPLVRLRQRLLAKGRSMTVGNLSPQIYELFAVMRLDKVFDARLAGQEAEPGTAGDSSDSPSAVLVVDDETEIQSALRAVLRIEGYKVWLAGHGHQAVELYRRHCKETAVVLLDVLMPGMDGPHTLAALRKLCPTVRSCFMTGDPTPYTEGALLQMGAVRVFRKPFDFTEVIDTLNQLAIRSPRRRQDRWIETPCKGV